MKTLGQMTRKSLTGLSLVAATVLVMTVRPADAFAEDVESEQPLAAKTASPHVAAKTASSHVAAKTANKSKSSKTKKSSKASAKMASAPKGKLSRDVVFDGSVVNGKYLASGEAVSTVENEKTLNNLIGMRADFKDRLSDQRAELRSGSLDK